MTTAAELTCLKSFQTAAGKTYVTQSTSGGTLFHRCLIPATSVAYFTQTQHGKKKTKANTQNKTSLHPESWLTVVSCRYRQRYEFYITYGKTNAQVSAASVQSHINVNTSNRANFWATDIIWESDHVPQSKGKCQRFQAWQVSLDIQGKSWKGRRCFHFAKREQERENWEELHTFSCTTLRNMTHVISFFCHTK